MANWKSRSEGESILSPYMRPAGAARYLSVSPRTLRNWTRARVVGCIKPGGGRVVLYSRADLDACLRRLRFDATPGA